MHQSDSVTNFTHGSPDRITLWDFWNSVSTYFSITGNACIHAVEEWQLKSMFFQSHTCPETREQQWEPHIQPVEPSIRDFAVDLYDWSIYADFADIICCRPSITNERWIESKFKSSIWYPASIWVFEDRFCMMRKCRNQSLRNLHYYYKYKNIYVPIFVSSCAGLLL